MKNIARRVQGGSRLIRELLPAIKRVTGQRMRWEALQESGLVTVGQETYGLPNVYYWDDKTKLRIGKYCSIAEGVVFILGGEHRIDWLTTFPFSAMPGKWSVAKIIEGHPATKGDIIVGNDVWIGHGATILSGVTIGDGAVVGAGSVIASNVEDYAIVAGNPARFVKYRFDETTRIDLKKLAWWDWPREKVIENMNKLMSAPDGLNFETEN